MARKRKNVVDYFPHSTHKDKYLLYLKKKYGKDAIVFWWELMEQLGQIENHYLDFGDEFYLETFSLDVDIVESKLSEMIDQLSKWNVIDEELWNTSKIVWMQSFVDDIEDVYLKRKRSKPDKSQVISVTEKELLSQELSQIHSDKDISVTGIPQSKVKENKGKEIKEKKTKVKANATVLSSPSIPESEEQLSKAENNGTFSHSTATEGEAKAGSNNVTDFVTNLNFDEEQNTDVFEELIFWYPEDWEQFYWDFYTDALQRTEIEKMEESITVLDKIIPQACKSKHLSKDQKQLQWGQFSGIKGVLESKIRKLKYPEKKQEKPKTEKPMDIAEQFETLFGNHNE